MRLWIALVLCSCVAHASLRVRLGSKKFTESVLIAELATQLLAASDVSADHRKELGGTRVLWDALLRGDLDAYPEYTGTIANELLGEPTLVTVPALREALAKRGVRMSAPLGFEDNYALGIPRQIADQAQITSISDLARHPELRLGLSHEFMNRADGWPLLRKSYGLPQAATGLDHDLAYRAIESGAIDVTDLYTTDAEARRYDLCVLEDDRHMFPTYEAVLLERADLPTVAVSALQRLEGAIDLDTMRSMNGRARLDHVPEPVVAAEFLTTRFGIPSAVTVSGPWSRLWLRTREHLFLVGISLLVAIAVAIPLGILASRRRRLGAAILAASGVLQTIPSLAMLVFMIPLLGIGTRPAIMSLFLYSLLPIVRNTHAGLVTLAPELRESAEALGLPSRARLRLIELPWDPLESTCRHASLSIL